MDSSRARRQTSIGFDLLEICFTLRPKHLWGRGRGGVFDILSADRQASVRMVRAGRRRVITLAESEEGSFDGTAALWAGTSPPHPAILISVYLFALTESEEGFIDGCAALWAGAFSPCPLCLCLFGSTNLLWLTCTLSPSPPHA